MSKSIKITLKKADGNYDLRASKLFGAPVFPKDWSDKFPDEVIFFGQIRLSDIADLDTENKLPHTGYLYLLLDTEIDPDNPFDDPYTAWVEHYDGEPNTVIYDFNEIEPRFAHLNQAFLMSFEEAEEDYYSTKLFGVPSAETNVDGELLMQFDPLDVATGFLEEVDGYGHFFFGEGNDRTNGARFAINRN